MENIKSDNLDNTKMQNIGFDIFNNNESLELPNNELLLSDKDNKIKNISLSDKTSDSIFNSKFLREILKLNQEIDNFPQQGNFDSIKSAQELELQNSVINPKSISSSSLHEDLSDSIEEESELKFNYRSINPYKERLLYQKLENFKNKEKNLEKVESVFVRENDVQNNIVSTILNPFTKSFFYSNTQSDIVQCSLDYNNYLICELSKYSKKFRNESNGNSLFLLWENLKKLSKNADNYLKSFHLKNDLKYCSLYEKYIKEGTSKELNIEKQPSSILNNLNDEDDEKMLQNKRGRIIQDQEFIIVIDKSILGKN